MDTTLLWCSQSKVAEPKSISFTLVLDSVTCVTYVTCLPGVPHPPQVALRGGAVLGAPVGGHEQDVLRLQVRVSEVVIVQELEKKGRLTFVALLLYEVEDERWISTAVASEFST